MNETDQPAPAITLNWPEPPPGYKLLCKYVSLTKATSARMFFPRDGGWDDERMRYPSLKASYIDNYWLAVKETDEPADAPAKDAGETPRVDAFLESLDESMSDFRAYRKVSDFARTLEREAAALRGALELAKHMLGPHFIRSCGTCEKCGGTTPNGTLRVCRTCGISTIDAALADGKGDKPCGQG